MSYTFTVSDRFLRYVQIDTQSDPFSSTCPSTAKQKDLGKVLVEELLTIGLSDAHMDEHGYVYATLPSNTNKTVPVLCFCSHMDTSPDSSGTNVKPLVHKNYQGQDIILPDDTEQVISPSRHKELKNQIGNDIITSSGLTLLGADDKAGLAEIMDALHYFVQHPEVKHGTIKVLFTPDEEIGRGTDLADLKKLGADFGYTMDGSTLGNMENENFSADGVTIKIQGVSAHPGFAKGKMESAIKIAGAIVEALPKEEQSPETTEKKEGFIHPTRISGSIESAEINFIIRDFITANLGKKEALLQKITDTVLKDYPRSSAELIITEQYRNMKDVLDKHPQLVEYALEAIKRTGVSPKLTSIRGGTDGARLSYLGLPCPNIFAGGHAFHSRQEWVSIQDMQKAVETIVHLCQIWEEKA